MNQQHQDVVDNIQDIIANQNTSSGILQQIGEARSQDFFSDYTQGGSFRDNFNQ
ncbi:MAG: hypothetical protein H6766_07040 [Candidatus Peribacteria bacterium]|nr:MAG: hypothetical protein H6766_07040 [Candidatus Peribacteria bacterium]